MRYRIVPERSQLVAEARSSLHPIRVETTGLQGYLEARVTDGRVDLELPAHLEFEAERLKTGNALLDGELVRRLEVGKFPRVVGEARSIQSSGDGRFSVRGDLSMHGTTRNLDGEVRIRSSAENTLEVEVDKLIDMRDFDLNPPKILMLRVYPEVQVHVRIVAEREQ